MPKQPRNYFTLVSRPREGGPWCIEFGDYARSTVNMEMLDRRDEDKRTYKRGTGPKYMVIQHMDNVQLRTVEVLNKIGGYNVCSN